MSQGPFPKIYRAGLPDAEAMQFWRKASEHHVGRLGCNVASNLIKASQTDEIPLLEIFTKRRTITFRQTNQLRWGLDKTKWEEFKKQGEMYKKRCGIITIELFHENWSWSGSVLAQRLHILGEPIPGEPQYNQAHMVYWLRKQFATLAIMRPTEMLGIAEGAIECRSYKFALEQIFAPFKQGDLF